jgi:starch synthase
MPCLYEPCGLSQMRSQRYGVPVLARNVGGLRDTVIDGETGFIFDEYTPAAFDRAMDRVLDGYRDRDGWEAMMRTAMRRDFGWPRSAEQYATVYDLATTHANRRS